MNFPLRRGVSRALWGGLVEVVEHRLVAVRLLRVAELFGYFD